LKENNEQYLLLSHIESGGHVDFTEVAKGAKFAYELVMTKLKHTAPEGIDLSFSKSQFSIHLARIAPYVLEHIIDPSHFIDDDETEVSTEIFLSANIVNTLWNWSLSEWTFHPQDESYILPYRYFSLFAQAAAIRTAIDFGGPSRTRPLTSKPEESYFSIAELMLICSIEPNDLEKLDKGIDTLLPSKYKNHDWSFAELVSRDYTTYHFPDYPESFYYTFGRKHVEKYNVFPLKEAKYVLETVFTEYEPTRVIS
jgi:hypothetical protein